MSAPARTLCAYIFGYLFVVFCILSVSKLAVAAEKTPPTAASISGDSCSLKGRFYSEGNHIYYTSEEELQLALYHIYPAAGKISVCVGVIKRGSIAKMEQLPNVVVTGSFALGGKWYLTIDSLSPNVNDFLLEFDPATLDFKRLPFATIDAQVLNVNLATGKVGMFGETRP